MAKIGVITFSDGRKHVHEDSLEVNRQLETRLVEALKADGHEVVVADEFPWSNVTARAAGMKMQKAGVDFTIFHYAIWAWPHYTTIAAQFAPGPYLCFSNINPRYSGLVGMLASSGALDNIGIPYVRVFGDIDSPDVLRRIRAFTRAASAVKGLKGETFGCFGGRPMGMYTATSGTDHWMKTFGVDVEHIDQWEIVRRTEDIDPERIESAFKWLESNVGNIYYDGNKLTPEILKRQIASYYAVKEICEEMNFDFCGVKAQPELTNNFCTMDLAEAFLNDPYDFDGPKDPMVCATEADMDGALTMQIFKKLAGTPVLFADVRHYHNDVDVLDLVNSGQHATYFAGKSFDYRDNLPKVSLYPALLFFPAGGASVQHLAHPGKVTLARLGRKDGKYWMAIVPSEFVQFDEKKNQEIMDRTQTEWPHAFARIEDVRGFIEEFPCNHIHGVYGDYVEELILVCKLLGIDYKILR